MLDSPTAHMYKHRSSQGFKIYILYHLGYTPTGRADADLSGVQKMNICTKNISDKLASVGQFGPRNSPNLSYCQIFEQLVMQMFRQHAKCQCQWQWLENCWKMFCQTVQYLESVVSNSPLVGLCCVPLSDGL